MPVKPKRKYKFSKGLKRILRKYYGLDPDKEERKYNEDMKNFIEKERKNEKNK